MSTEYPLRTSTMRLLSEFIVIKFKLKPVFLLIITNRIKFSKEFKRLICIRISRIKEIGKTSSRIYLTRLPSWNIEKTPILILTFLEFFTFRSKLKCMQ